MYGLKRTRAKNYQQIVNNYYNFSSPLWFKFWGPYFHMCLRKPGETRQQAYLRTHRYYLDFANLTKKSRVIDLGCGPGYFSFFLLKEVGCKVTGIDINQEGLKIAEREKRKRKLKNIQFLKIDMMGMPFKNEFEAAFLIEVDPHLPNKQKAIRQIYKALKKKGRLVMIAWCKKNNINPLEEEFFIEPLCQFGAFPYMEISSNYKKIFQAEGFKTIKVKDLSKEMFYGVQREFERLLRVFSQLSLKEVMKFVIKKPRSIGQTRGLKQKLHNQIRGAIYGRTCLEMGLFQPTLFVVEKH